MTSTPVPHELRAPAHWRAIEFISDLHLCGQTPQALTLLQQHLAHSDADAVLLLGDVFEIWIGDDALQGDDGAGPERPLLQALAGMGRQRWIGFMHGNRDFLVGAAALAQGGWHALPDPTVLDAFGRRWLLSHGDGLCLADHDYQRFRLQSRDERWQQQFLARPLAERRQIARQLRDASESRKSSVGFDGYADVDTAEALRWLQAAAAETLIHGHTHRPARHQLDERHERWVLSDWDLAATPPRADLLRLSATGLERRQLLPVASATA
jgi:UDP-2,3-diacylglucosamine hydrolase